MKKWKCTVCGYIHDGDSPPDRCPVCGAPKEKFVPLTDEAEEQNQEDSASRQADVLVVGSGAAAFAAAVTAREGGASVIMLEKADDIGGTTGRSGGGYWAPGNRWQKALGYEDNREDCLRYMARYSFPHLYDKEAPHYGVPAQAFALMEAYVDNAKEMAAFFDDIGALHSIEEINWTGKPQVDYMDHLPENKGIRGRTLYPKDQDGKQVPSGAELIRQMEQWARAHGVQIHTHAEVTAILQGEDHRVHGVEVLLNGTKQRFDAAKGVIFGSGGYSHDAQRMLQWQRGPHYGGCSVPTNTGDLIRMAGALGAQMGNTPGAFRAQSMIEAHLANPGGSSNVFYLIGDSMLLVNKYGKRILNEKRNYTDRTMLHFLWDPVKAEWTNMLTFWIFDQRCLDLWQGFPPFPIGGQAMPYLIQRDTLEALSAELAQRLSHLSSHTGGFALDESFLPTLHTTLQEYNHFAKEGVDPQFHRGETLYDSEWTTFPPTLPQAQWPPEGSKNPSMYPLSSKGPYYAIILAAGTLDTNGGPVIDRDGRILDWAEHPIQGLYGAGNCIASPTVNAYWGAGSTIGPAMTFGYLAARHCLGKEK